MTISTDKVRVKGGTDFSFICGKIPFAISCSSTLHHGSYNLIDLELVNKMKIPLQKIKVCRMTYLGENLRSVGYIDQTIQCVQNGKVQGTIHLSAKVVRNLFDNLNVDCVASYKTYEKLTGDKPPDPPDTEIAEDTIEEDVQNEVQNDCHDTTFSSTSSSTCSDNIPAISKDWLWDATFMANVAQQDSKDTLLRLENEKANVRNDDESNNEPEEDEEDDNKYDNAKTETEDEEPDEWSKYPDFHCDHCFHSGQPVKIVTNHSTDCPTCPTLTLAQKEHLFGKDWKARAEKIFRGRFRREQERRKSSADQ